MMRPHLRRFMPGTAARMVWNDDDRLMAITASHFSVGKSSMLATCWMPALLTRMSSLPNSFSVVGDHGGDLAGLRHVGAGIARLDAELLLQAAALLLDRARLAEAVEHHVGAGFGQRAGDGEPDPGGGAGDQRGFAFEHGCPRCCARPSKGRQGVDLVVARQGPESCPYFCCGAISIWGAGFRESSVIALDFPLKAERNSGQTAFPRGVPGARS